jgi:addiction module HigA family antidote
MYENGLPPIHPGEFVGETLAELQMTEVEFARALGLPTEQVHALIAGTSPITADVALLLGRAFDQSPHYWLNLQSAYDLKMATATIGGRLARVQPIAPQPPRHGG